MGEIAFGDRIVLFNGPESFLWKTHEKLLAASLPHVCVCHLIFHRRFADLKADLCLVSWRRDCSHVSCLSDVEECQLSECGGEEELGGGESPLPRSSSTSDIAQQLADHFPGINAVIKIEHLGCIGGNLNINIYI